MDISNFEIADDSNNPDAATARNDLYSLKLELNQFPADGMARDYAVRLHSKLNSGKDPTPDDIAHLTSVLRTQRNFVRGWAKSKLKTKIVQFAQKHGISHPTDVTTTVNSIGDLSTAWAQDETLAKEVWHAVFGEFDSWKNWEIALEDEFMNQYKWEYSGFANKKRDLRQKGCIAKVMSWQKNQLVKCVNYATGKTHGKKVTVTQPPPLAKTDEGKQRRRKIGEFHDWSVKQTTVSEHQAKRKMDNKVSVFKFMLLMP